MKARGENSFLFSNVIFPAQAEYSGFSVTFRLTIVLQNSYFISYDISVLDMQDCNWVSTIFAQVFTFRWLVKIFNTVNYFLFENSALNLFVKYS